MASPNTALPTRSIWRSLAQETFYRKLDELERLKSVLPGKNYSLSQQNHDGRNSVSLSIGDEKELADNFAFIASRDFGALFVTVATLEENPDRQGLTIRLAANQGIQPQVRKAFDKLCAVFRRCAQEGG